MKNVPGKQIALIICLVGSLHTVHPRPRNQAVSAPTPVTKTVAEAKKPEQAPVTTEPVVVQAPEPKNASITVKNVITPDMAAYNYCGKHTPEQFSLEVNGQAIASGDEKNIALTGNELEATYHYSFAKGLYKGSKTCAVVVPQKLSKAEIHFSWHKEPRVWLESSSTNNS